MRVLGKLAKDVEGVRAEKLPKLRLHVRAILRDGQDLFVGSQSLRSLELDKRREVGVIVSGRETIARFRQAFEEDWSGTDTAAKEAKVEEDAKKEKDKDAERGAASSRRSSACSRPSSAFTRFNSVGVWSADIWPLLHSCDRWDHRRDRLSEVWIRNFNASLGSVVR